MSPTKKDGVEKDAVVQVAPEIAEPRLKAERIQVPAVAPEGPGAATAKLKAERIQLVLRDLPGWRVRPGGHGIAREVEFQDPAQIARLLQYVTEVAFGDGFLPELTIRGGRITFALPTLEGSWLAPHHFDLARALNLRAA